MLRFIAARQVRGHIIQVLSKLVMLEIMVRGKKVYLVQGRCCSNLIIDSGTSNI